MPSKKTPKVCDICGFSTLTARKDCPSCWSPFPVPGQTSAHTGEVVGGNTKKKRAKADPWWTVVFMNREGLPLMFNAKPGWTERGPVDWCTYEQGPEKDVVNFFEYLMKSRTELSRLPPLHTYAAGIWPGKLRDKSDLETVRPRFYVYEGGNTHVVA
jgi:hypothetical protein